MYISKQYNKVQSKIRWIRDTHRNKKYLADNMWLVKKHITYAVGYENVVNEKGSTVGSWNNSNIDTSVLDIQVSLTWVSKGDGLMTAKYNNTEVRYHVEIIPCMWMDNMMFTKKKHRQARQID